MYYKVISECDLQNQIYRFDLYPCHKSVLKNGFKSKLGVTKIDQTRDM